MASSATSENAGSAAVVDTVAAADGKVGAFTEIECALLFWGHLEKGAC